MGRLFIKDTVKLLSSQTVPFWSKMTAGIEKACKIHCKYRDLSIFEAKRNFICRDLGIPRSRVFPDEIISNNLVSTNTGPVISSQLAEVQNDTGRKSLGWTEILGGK